ncbi:hypothetical protein CIB48_g11049 [Xylaria polymorpha]|nr:hypothetical protein CIB48_g11049 [Xylaria polymorpha]
MCSSGLDEATVTVRSDDPLHFLGLLGLLGFLGAAELRPPSDLSMLLSSWQRSTTILSPLSHDGAQSVSPLYSQHIQYYSRTSRTAHTICAQTKQAIVTVQYPPESWQSPDQPSKDTLLPDSAIACIAAQNSKQYSPDPRTASRTPVPPYPPYLPYLRTPVDLPGSPVEIPASSANKTPTHQSDPSCLIQYRRTQVAKYQRTIDPAHRTTWTDPRSLRQLSHHRT